MALPKQTLHTMTHKFSNLRCMLICVIRSAFSIASEHGYDSATGWMTNVTSTSEKASLFDIGAFGLNGGIGKHLY